VCLWQSLRPCSFGFVSLESDLQTSAESFKTRASPRWLPTSSGPAAPSPAQRVANTCQGRHCLDRHVRVTTCLPRRGWCLFGGSSGSGGRLRQMMVPGGGACSTRAVASYVFACVFGVLLLLFFSLFTVCFYDTQMLRDCLLA
jgi:hypothetical protein